MATLLQNARPVSLNVHVKYSLNQGNLYKLILSLNSTLILLEFPTMLEAPDPSSKRLLLTLKAQNEILKHILPAIQQAVDQVVEFMADDDDDEAISNYLRELAVETTIDEMVKMLTRDPEAPSKIYTLRDVDGIVVDTLIACYSELHPEKARRWYAQQMDMTPQQHAQLTAHIPRQLDL